VKFHGPFFLLLCKEQDAIYCDEILRSSHQINFPFFAHDFLCAPVLAGEQISTTEFKTKGDDQMCAIVAEREGISKVQKAIPLFCESK